MSLRKWLFGIGDTDTESSESPDRSDAGLALAIEQRPVPEGSDPDLLLPMRVGVFVRAPIRSPVRKGMPIYADYSHLGREVFVELSICDGKGEAQMALSTAMSEMKAEFPDVPQSLTKRRDIWLFKTSNANGSFIAWTRGSYYFSVHAKGGNEVVVEFMKDFPY